MALRLSLLLLGKALGSKRINMY